MSKALYEKHRPADWGEVAGQAKAVEALRRLESRGTLAGQAYWISGPSGCGKTTLARIIASKVADPWGVEEYGDPSELTAAVLGDMGLHCNLRGLYRFAFIVNEIHGATVSQVRKLLSLTENAPEWVTWVFTTTAAGQDGLFERCIDSGPLLSRCKLLELGAPVEAFAARVKHVAMLEGVDGMPLEAYAGFLAENKGNMRAALQGVESGQFGSWCVTRAQRQAEAELARRRLAQEQAK